jgi:hypothetical protein
VRLQNISRTGLALIVDRNWESGTNLIVELPTAEGGATPSPARVVHATPRLGGLFLIGCILEIPLNEAQLKILTA